MGGIATRKRPFNEYDRAIFDVCNSARESGLIGITRDSIFRILTCSEHRSPRPNQANAIIESVKRLMTTIEIDFSHTRDKISKYLEVPAQLISSILPCKILHNVLVNGQPTSLIKFTDESPLMTIARVKKQIITYPVALRDIPNQNNTPLVIMLKSYVIRRVLEIKLHSQLTPAITFDDIFSKCRLDNANKFKREDARNAVIKFFEHLKSQKVITNFQVRKHGNSIHRIEFSF